MAQLAPAEVDVVIELALAELSLAEWVVIDARGDATRRADFLVVGPPGVFVIGCGRPNERERARAKQLMQLLEAALQLAEVAGVRRDEVHPVLCLTGEAAEDYWDRGVTVCGTANLTDTLTLNRKRLGRDEVEAAAQALARVTQTAGKHRAG